MSNGFYLLPKLAGAPALVEPYSLSGLSISLFAPLVLKINPIRFDIHQYRDLSVGPWDGDGILETVTSIHGLIEHEIKANGIPIDRIVVAGLSQGSAMAVWSGLTFTGGKLAGICGIAGRLPAKELLREVGGIPVSHTILGSYSSRCCPLTRQDYLSGWAMEP
jgi:predicted esterase